MIFKFAAWLSPFFKAREEKKWRKEINQPKKVLAGHVLYHFQISWYSKPVREALYTMPIKIEMKDTLIDDQAFQELLKGGGKDQVPCLKIESASGTRWMYESKDIIRYLKEQC